MDGSRESQAFQSLTTMVPVMTKEKFAEHSGLTKDDVQEMIEEGHLPSISIGGYLFVNLALLAKECVSADGGTEVVPPH